MAFIYSAQFTTSNLSGLFILPLKAYYLNFDNTKESIATSDF
jgi:hypothetical protein